MRELERIVADIPPARLPATAGAADVDALSPAQAGARCRRRRTRDAASHDLETAARPPSVGVVGRGRVGRTLARALAEAGHPVDGPAGRGELPAGEVILLCVPDAEISRAASAVAGRARLVGHTSGATPLRALEPARDAGAETFGLHPLQTIADDAASLSGCSAAVAGSSPQALAQASALARSLGMVPFAIDDERRAAYHAAASIASNFLVTLEASAEAMAAEAGLAPDEARELLRPLVETTVRNWARLGPERALTGPVARGDESTLAAQRGAVAATRPELVALFDALVERTRALAGVRR